jgi:hypothetical protein
MAKLEYHSPEHLKINPNGVIPTLIHDRKPMHESGTIFNSGSFNGASFLDLGTERLPALCLM